MVFDNLTKTIEEKKRKVFHLRTWKLKHFLRTTYINYLSNSNLN